MSQKDGYEPLPEHEGVVDGGSGSSATPQYTLTGEDHFSSSSSSTSSPSPSPSPYPPPQQPQQRPPSHWQPSPSPSPSPAPNPYQTGYQHGGYQPGYQGTPGGGYPPGGYQAYQPGVGYVPAGGGYETLHGQQSPLRARTALSYDEEVLIQTDPNSYGALPTLMNSVASTEVSSQLLHGTFLWFRHLKHCWFERTPWLWPLQLSIFQLLMTILILTSGDTIFVYVIGSLAIFPHFLGIFAIYMNTARPIPRKRRATITNNNTNTPTSVTLYDIRYNNGSLAYDFFKFLHIMFSYLVCLSAFASFWVNASFDGHIHGYGYHVWGTFTFWLLSSITTAFLTIHYRKHELLFRWVWQEIINSAHTDASSHPPVHNDLSTLLKIDDANKFFYEVAPETPSDEEKGVFPSPHHISEHSVEIYRSANTCCGCIQDGETMLDINRNRITGAILSCCYPLFCGNLKYLTVWFEQVPSASLQTVERGWIPNRFSVLALFFGIPWLFCCSQQQRKAFISISDPGGSGIAYPVHMYHAQSVRNVLVRAIGSWRTSRVMRGGTEAGPAVHNV